MILPAKSRNTTNASKKEIDYRCCHGLKNEYFLNKDLTGESIDLEV